MSKKFPFILVLIIIINWLIQPLIPITIKQFILAISLNIKSIIILLLPIIIFGLIFKTTILLSQKAINLILTVLLLVCFSNFFSTIISYLLGSLIYKSNFSIVIPKQTISLQPLWNLHIPTLDLNSKALFLGFILGFIFSKMSYENALRISHKIEILVNGILKIIIFSIPFFIIGCTTKLQYDGVLTLIFKEYIKIFLLVTISLSVYIFLLYFIFSKCNVKKFCRYIKNMLPSYITALTSMSSAAAMPLTITGVEKNSANKNISNYIVPITVNIHLIGDCFAIPIFAYSILKSFGYIQPAFTNYLIFSSYFVLAKFSVAAIPGGGILVMLPILEKYLNLNNEMLSLITALYILFDPIITGFNVLGNGAFSKFIDLLVTFFNKKLKFNILK